MRVVTIMLSCLGALASSSAQVRVDGELKGGDRLAKPAESAQAAIGRLALPGIKINLAERSVDVAAEICLDEGTLELVACKKDSKEHESIISTSANAIHIHTALLLLGAEPGNPAMRKRVGTEEEDGRWIEVPPKGDPVEVSLVIEDENGDQAERPIREFIEAADPAGETGADDKKRAQAKKFPAHGFVFAGSHLITEGEGPRAYASDRSGNLISIATFGDELLCLPGINGHDDGSLLWQIDRTHLPEVGTRVTLRLRPKSK
ncbi:MAG: YdjY domain-containing protein [Verrucomicrobiales bacterium]